MISTCASSITLIYCLWALVIHLHIDASHSIACLSFLSKHITSSIVATTYLGPLSMHVLQPYRPAFRWSNLFFNCRLLLYSLGQLHEVEVPPQLHDELSSTRHQDKIFKRNALSYLKDRFEGLALVGFRVGLWNLQSINRQEKRLYQILGHPRSLDKAWNWQL